jgi:hypothetical protein
VVAQTTEKIHPLLWIAKAFHEALAVSCRRKAHRWREQREKGLKFFSYYACFFRIPAIPYWELRNRFSISNASRL